MLLLFGVETRNSDTFLYSFLLNVDIRLAGTDSPLIANLSNMFLPQQKCSVAIDKYIEHFILCLGFLEIEVCVSGCSQELVDR